MIDKEIIVNWIGAIVLALAFIAGIIGIIWTTNTYGNQLAKQCIKQGRNWTLINDRYNQWECK